MWERRTALYACLWCIMKQKSVEDTEAVCELLIGEKEEIIQKAVGTMVRCMGIDRPRLHAFLQKHAAHDAARGPALCDRGTERGGQEEIYGDGKVGRIERSEIHHRAALQPVHYRGALHAAAGFRFA